ncbi:MAG: tetratricopeptide repeat protein [Reichenbachiella sp.]|uniref:tetratricopeptide repeat protein n=1 Tax=Reichenbachiella sp. TaxID=2184521 RepID=UPI0032659D25
MQTFLAFLLLAMWPFSNEKIADRISEVHSQAKNYYVTHPDSTIILLQIALEESKEANYNYGEAKSNFILGSLMDREGNTDQAVSYLLDALTVFIGMNDQKSLADQAKVCLLLGVIYRQHYRINEAIDFYDKGMTFALEASDQKTFIQLLHNKAIILRKIGEAEKAKQLLISKFEMIEANDKEQQLKTYNELGLVYHELNVFDSARSFYQQMIDLETGSVASRFRGQAYHNLANLFQQQKDYVEAWRNYEKALAEKEPLGNAKDLFITYQDMANLALIQGNSNLALSYAEKATPLMPELPETSEYFDQFKLLAQCFESVDIDKSYAYISMYGEKYEAFEKVQKDLIEKGQGYKMDLITANYFNKQRQDQQQAKLYWTLASALIFLFLGGFVSRKLWKIYRYKSPEVALSTIKNQNEMIFLMDMFRSEKEELRNVVKQIKKK